MISAKWFLNLPQTPSRVSRRALNYQMLERLLILSLLVTVCSESLGESR